MPKIDKKQLMRLRLKQLEERLDDLYNVLIIKRTWKHDEVKTILAYHDLILSNIINKIRSDLNE